MQIENKTKTISSLIEQTVEVKFSYFSIFMIVIGKLFFHEKSSQTFERPMYGVTDGKSVCFFSINDVNNILELTNERISAGKQYITIELTLFQETNI